MNNEMLIQMLKCYDFKESSLRAATLEQLKKLYARCVLVELYADVGEQIFGEEIRRYAQYYTGEEEN